MIKIGIKNRLTDGKPILNFLIKYFKNDNIAN